MLPTTLTSPAEASTAVTLDPNSSGLQSRALTTTPFRSRSIPTSASCSSALNRQAQPTRPQRTCRTTAPFTGECVATASMVLLYGRKAHSRALTHLPHRRWSRLPTAHSTPTICPGLAGEPPLPSGTTFLHYRLQVAKDSAFTQELQEKLIDSRTTPFYQYLEGEMLDPDTRYYWRVQAWNTNEHYSTWSAVRYFRTAMVKPTLLTPAEGVTVTTRRPSFEWTPDVGATSYTIQLSTYSNFSTLIRSASPADPTWTSTVSLPQNKTIYWRVRANGANGPSLWAVGTFKSANPPSTPTLVSPSNGAILKTLTPKLDWSNSSLPAGTTFKHYELQVAKDQYGFYGCLLSLITK
jgi:hypothetical protein